MLIFWFVLLFVIGAAVGSFLNVCVYRLPYEKSLFWPGSHCGHCYQPIRWDDNLPLVSWLLLRGRCRTCGARFSFRYFLVELGTALVFMGLFYAEIVENALHIPYLTEHHSAIVQGDVPPRAWAVFAYHAVLICFLIVTSLCDLDHMEIPLSVTVTGTIVGVIGGTLLPWPFPNEGVTFPPPNPLGVVPKIPSGAVHWPVWNPRELPAWMHEGTWQLGLATSLAGVLAGMVMLRAIRFLFGVSRGIEGMGMGDADLMMMAGAFLGWQPTVAAFFASVLPGLALGILQLFRKGNHPFPFGPALALGVVLTLFFWPPVGNQYRLVFFEGTVLVFIAGFFVVALLAIGFLLRLIRGRAQ
jgi:leader peptidase (prepilin peptidase)/N-methyltransferase